MSEMHLGAVESRFADIIWNNAPLGSGELVKLAESELGWKKSTTYTILRRLCQRGLFKNEDGTVSVIVPKADFAAMQSREFLDESFGGSLPAFIAAFSARESLSREDIGALQRLIDEARG